MNKLRTSWSPFPIGYSSCSSLKPKNFEWSNSEGIATVWIDNNMTNHTGPARGNFGWFCESSEVIPGIKNDLINNHLKFKNHFTAIFTCDHEIISRDPSFFIFNPPGSNLPWTKPENYRIAEKSKICSMIASAKNMTTGHRKRIEIASSLKNSADVFGGAAGTTRIGTGIGPNGDWWRSKEEALAPYMFSIVIENASYSNYYTEKITDCFVLGVIPIYWGSPDIGKDFNTDGIIQWHEGFDTSILTRELYESKLPAVLDNLERVKRLEFSDDKLYNSIIVNV